MFLKTLSGKSRIGYKSITPVENEKAYMQTVNIWSAPKIQQRLVIALVVLAMLALGHGCGGPGKGITLTAEEGTEIRVYEVFGMDCPGCHGGVEKLVNRVEGVVTSVANWTTRRIAVKARLEANVTDEAVFEAIKRANFTPGERIK